MGSGIHFHVKAVVCTGTGDGHPCRIGSGKIRSVDRFEFREAFHIGKEGPAVDDSAQRTPGFLNDGLNVLHDPAYLGGDALSLEVTRFRVGAELPREEKQIARFDGLRITSNGCQGSRG